MPCLLQFWVATAELAIGRANMRNVKNISKYASPQFQIDNVPPRMKEAKTMSINPFLSGALHQRFERRTLGLSFCDFAATREDRRWWGLTVRKNGIPLHHGSPQPGSTSQTKAITTRRL